MGSIYLNKRKSTFKIFYNVCEIAGRQLFEWLSHFYFLRQTHCSQGVSEEVFPVYCKYPYFTEPTGHKASIDEDSTFQTIPPTQGFQRSEHKLINNFEL